MLVYVSGKYTAATVAERMANIQAARKIAGELWKLGHAVICPHLNTANFEEDFPGITYDQYIEGDLMMVARCDALVMVDGWNDSKGAKIEHDYAARLGIPIFYAADPHLPPLHITERRAPHQAKRFAEVLGVMYRTHLQKNADYSPANILGTGEIGVTVRLWDKIARLLNLMGFRITISEASYEAPRDPLNESIDDTLLDAANYAVIAALVREGSWGK